MRRREFARLARKYLLPHLPGYQYFLPTSFTSRQALAEIVEHAVPLLERVQTADDFVNEFAVIRRDEFGKRLLWRRALTP